MVACQGVGQGRPGDGFDADERIALGVPTRDGTRQQVSRNPRGRAGIGRRVATSTAIKPVGAGTALERIVAATARKGVRNSIPRDAIIAVAEECVLDDRPGGERQVAAAEMAGGAGP